MAVVQDLKVDTVLHCLQALLLIEIERSAGNFPLGVFVVRDASDEAQVYRLTWSQRPRRDPPPQPPGGRSA